MNSFFSVDGLELHDGSFFLIAGPCVIEGEEMALRIAGEIRKTCDSENIPFIFKASFDKANRSSVNSFRGVGMEKGLDILSKVKRDVGVPVLSDVHETSQVGAAAQVLSIIQIPAFLSRQTDLLQAAASTGLPVNIKKGQFMAPEDMALAAEKVITCGNRRIMLTERGTFFGYHNLVVDFRNIPIMKQTGFPVVLDATHSLQRPAGAGVISGGNPEYIPLMAAAGITAGADGIFIEVHPDPVNAKSDKHTSLDIKKLPGLLIRLKKLYNLA